MIIGMTITYSQILRHEVDLEDTTPEGEEVTQRLIVMMVRAQEEEVDIFLVAGVAVLELVVVAGEVQEGQLHLL